MNIQTYVDAPQNIEALVLKSIAALQRVVSPCVEGENCVLSLKVGTDDDVQALNRDFRGKDKPTNVLSFPVWEEDPDEESLYLGDIIIAQETLEKEADEQNLTTEAHLQHLVVHGVLHLFGFDHIKDGEAEVMEDLEIRILAILGLDNPYV